MSGINLVFRLMAPCFLAIAACSCNGNGGGDDNVPEPYITEISTDFEGKAVVGEPVSLKGVNFSPKASENKVVYGVGFDATYLTVTESSEEHVVFTAPSVPQTQLKIRVSVKGVESNSVVLEYADEPEADPEEPWSDTPTIVLEGASTETVRPGVEWTTFHGRWKGEVRNINIVRATLDEHNSMGVFFDYATEGLMDLDEKCNHIGAIAGTNGSMACCQFVRVNGNQEHGAVEADPWIVNCALTIDSGVVDIVKVRDNFKAAKLTNAADGVTYLPPDNTLTVAVGGPLLVWEGRVQKNTQEWIKADKSNWLYELSPRTALGLSSDGKTVIQVAVDGRWDRSSFDERAIGMSTELLAELMRGLGCYKAMNFDGGGGTAMWVYGYGNSRNIVNHVSENRWTWNGTTLRATGCAVYVKTDLK